MDYSTTTLFTIQISDKCRSTVLQIAACLPTLNHLQQGSLRSLRGKQTNYKEVCAQQTMKMPHHIMQTEGTDVILPQMNHFFWEH